MPVLAGEAIQAPQAEVRKLIEAGLDDLGARRYQQALHDFEEALRKSPASREARDGLVQVHRALGIEFTNSGENGQARESFERALRYGEDAVARFGLGYLDFLELRDGPAKENLQRALAGDPKEPRTYKLLALIEYRRGDTAAALKLMVRAVELDPKDSEAAAFRKRWDIEDKLSAGLSSVSTKHFLVRYDRSIHPETAREISASLEKIHDSLGHRLGHWPSKQIPVLFLGDKDFYEATGSFDWVGGVYDGQIKVPVKPEAGRPGADRKTIRRTLRHEFTHAIIKEMCPGCPNWLNEGIAQYFEIEGPQEAGGDEAAAERKARRDQVARELKAVGSKRIPLEKVPPMMWKISDPGYARLAYREGLSFVDYLVEKHGAFRLSLLLRTIARTGSLVEAFRSTYGAPFAAIEESWWSSLTAE